jgi:serine protease Do
MTKVKLLSIIAISIGFLVSSLPSQARMSPRQIYKQKSPGVVLIVANKKGSSSASAGTGSIIRSDGTVITNAHVIFDESTKAVYPVIHIFTKPKRVTGNMNKDLKHHHKAEVISYDRSLDLAILKMKQAPSNLVVITLGDPEEVGPGDETIAIGHPEQGGLWTITTGVIGTQFEDFKGVPGKHVFQMETSLNRGNSGGPLFDIRGYQIGVNTSIARQGAGGVAITGVNFAVKSSVVKKWVNKYNVQLAYGPEKLYEESQPAATVATAKKTETKPVEPEPEKVAAAPEKKEKTSTQTYRDKESGGTITVEDGPEDDDSEAVAKAVEPEDSDATEVRRKIKKTPKRKPIRFKKHYRTRSRPYTYKKLFTAVDKVRDRAKKAFDDLDDEIRRRR